MGKRNTTVAELITDALLTLLREREYKNISISDITARAGVSRVSFYRNFSSREEILSRYLDEITDEFVRESRISYKEDPLETYVRKLFRHLHCFEWFSSLLGMVFVPLRESRIAVSGKSGV